MGKGKRNRTERKEQEKIVKEILSPQTVKPAVMGMAMPAAPVQEPKYSYKAMKKELANQLGAAHKEFLSYELSAILWVLHKEFGFGKKKLLRYVKAYKPTNKDLTDFYAEDYGEAECTWVIHKKLLEETGIDTANISDEMLTDIVTNHEKEKNS